MTKTTRQRIVLTCFVAADVALFFAWRAESAFVALAFGFVAIALFGSVIWYVVPGAFKTKGV